MLRKKNQIETKLKLIGFNPTIVKHSTTVNLKNSLPFAFRMIYFHLQLH